MKIIGYLYYLLIVSCLLTVQCSNKNRHNGITPPASFLRSDRYALNVTASSGKDSVMISSNEDWSISSVPSWLNVNSTIGGSGDKKVIFYYQSNINSDTRAANITISSSNSSLSALTISIKQGGDAPYLTADRLDLREDSAGQKDSVTITSNISWTLNIPSSALWVKADKITGSAGTSRIYFQIHPNGTGQVRAADITLSAQDNNILPVSIQLNQNAYYYIKDISSLQAHSGDTIIVNGLFGSHPVIKLNDIQARILSSMADKLVFIVPNDCHTGKITISFDGNLTLSSNEEIAISPDYIADFNPAVGTSGNMVTLNGIFGSDPVVKLNNVPASVIYNNHRAIAIAVPSNASTGKITISFGNTTITSNSDFILNNNPGQVSSNSLAGNKPYTYGVSFVYNNRIYYGLGIDATGVNYARDFKIFDPQTGLWSQGPSIPSIMSPRRYASCFTLNNIVYIGFGAYNNQADWWSFDPSKSGDDAWKQVASYNRPGFGGVSFSVASKAYAGIPYVDGIINQYDPTFNNGLGSWTAVAQGQFPSVLYSSVFSIDNYAYIVGGQSRSASSTSSTWLFDPFLNKVKLVANAPVVIKDAPSFSLNGKGYVLVNGSLYQYDPSADKWTFINSTPVFAGVYNAAEVNGIAYAWTTDGTVYKLAL